MPMPMPVPTSRPSDGTTAYHVTVLFGFLIFAALALVLAVFTRGRDRPAKSVDAQKSIVIHDAFLSMTPEHLGSIEKPFAVTRHRSSLSVGVFLAMPGKQAHLYDIAVLEAELVSLGNDKG
ncbi:hypothetical protein DL96DRAFT_1554875 [Flagelloscypha sp. PMI_526]|nr:hypothetical protein DL96DRAFT_1554875 [Flagelloscypha sp. PMI_526]